MRGNGQWQWRAQVEGLSPACRRTMREVCVLGLLAVVLVPAARGHHEWLGWWPLWLVAMPAAAWWAATGLPLPVWQPGDGHPRPRRLPRNQARRRPLAARRPTLAVTLGRGRSGRGCASVAGQ